LRFLQLVLNQQPAAHTEGHDDRNTEDPYNRTQSELPTNATGLGSGEFP
jgi:hypothetical protein